MVNCGVLSFFCLVCALSGQLVTADRKCVDYDEKIDTNVLDPLRKSLEESNATFLEIGEFTTGNYLGISLELSGGKIGDFAKFELDSEVSAALLCVDLEPSETVTTLEMTITAKKIDAIFDHFAVLLPILPTIGDTKTVISYQDSVIFISISTTHEGTACKPTLNSVEFSDLGELRFQFESGLQNPIYEFIFYHSWLFFKKFSTEFGIDEMVNKFIAVGFGPHFVKAYEETICRLIPQTTDIL